MLSNTVYCETKDQANQNAGYLELAEGKAWRVEESPRTGGFKAISEEEAKYWEENPPRH